MNRSGNRDFVQGFLRGFGRALDLRGAMVRPPRQRIRLSDTAALAADWDAVWNDLGEAFSRVKRRNAAAANGR